MAADKFRVWLRLDQVHLAIRRFTDDPLRRAAIRLALRESRFQWQAAWNDCFADALRNADREFATYLAEIGS
jgi:hypothetical protein